jgi:lipoate-protein ligase A
MTMQQVKFFYGHYQEDIFRFLASQEFFISRTSQFSNQVVIRTAEIAKPAITLARNESLTDIFYQNCLADGIDLTRRQSGGSVIFLDKNLLLYSLIFPSRFFPVLNLPVIHQEIGGKIALALKDLGVQKVYLGEKFSIALGKGPQFIISGNAVRKTKDYLLYEGILVLEPLNLEAIQRYIVLRKNEKVNEADLISQLPSLFQVCQRKINPQELGEKIADRISGEKWQVLKEEEFPDFKEKIKVLEEKYKSSQWLHLKEARQKDLGFCLIALLPEWQEKNFQEI